MLIIILTAVLLQQFFSPEVGCDKTLNIRLYCHLACKYSTSIFIYLLMLRSILYVKKSTGFCRFTNRSVRILFTQINVCTHYILFFIASKSFNGDLLRLRWSWNVDYEFIITWYYYNISLIPSRMYSIVGTSNTYVKLQNPISSHRLLQWCDVTIRKYYYSVLSATEHCLSYKRETKGMWILTKIAREPHSQPWRYEICVWTDKWRTYIIVYLIMAILAWSELLHMISFTIYYITVGVYSYSVCNVRKICILSSFVHIRLDIIPSVSLYNTTHIFMYTYNIIYTYYIALSYYIFSIMINDYLSTTLIIHIRIMFPVNI